MIDNSLDISKEVSHSQKSSVSNIGNDLSNLNNQKIIVDGINSTSLPTSPSRENGVSTSNSISTSLNNINEICRFKAELTSSSMVAEQNQLSLQNCNSSSNQVSDIGSNYSRSSIGQISNSQISNKSKKSLLNNLRRYQNKLNSFQKNFANSIAISEVILGDFPCAIAKNNRGILVLGKLFVTKNWICFYSKILTIENKIILPISGVISITKEKTAKVFPNAIMICTQTTKYFFTSFKARDKVYNFIFDLWDSHRNKEVISNSRMKSILFESYGIDKNPNVSDILNEDNKECDTKLLKKGSNASTEGESPSLTDNEGADGDEEVPDEEVELDDNYFEVITNENEDPEIYPDATKNIFDNAISNNSNNRRVSIKRKAAVVNPCEHHEHPGKMYLDVEIDMHVDKLFMNLFNNSYFFKKFLDSRKTTDVISEPWPDRPDGSGGKSRFLSYTLALKAKLGPKVSASEERQYLHGSSMPGLFYMVDTSVQNSGFPLADCFHCENRFCLLHISGLKSRLKVCSQIVYDKQLFFASKSLIESTSKSGLHEYYTDLENHLKMECRKGQNNTNCTGNYKIVSPLATNSLNANGSNLLNGKRVFLSHGQTSNNLPIVSNHANDHQQFADRRVISKSAHSKENSSCANENSYFFSQSFFRPERAWLIVIVLSLIICLCLSFLYSRFCQLEDITSHQIYLQQKIQNLPTSISSDSSILNSCNIKEADNIKSNGNNAKIDSDEVQQWKLIVDNSIVLIDQMKKVLLTVKSSLEKMDNEIKAASNNTNG